MRRARMINGVVSVALATALAAAPPAAADGVTALATATPRSLSPSWRPPHPPPPYGARLLGCRRALRLEGRVAVVGAWMRPIPGARRLALRADLFQRPLGGGRWVLRADVPGLSRWATPGDPELGASLRDIYKYRQAVAQLVVPYAYRFRVTFRWSDETGAVVREERVRTATCRQPDLRPDLVVGEVTVRRDAAGQAATYRAVVRNRGRTAAAGIEVGASFGATQRIRRLAPGAAATVTFAGPACPSAEVGPSIVVDPANLIDEARETNNRRLVRCPA